MSRPVSLAMYDAGGLAAAVFWDGLREHLAEEDVADLPDDLTLPDDYHAI